MPFESHLIHPEDPPLSSEGELQLPADLAALAEQLGDDARHLAAHYPAAWQSAARVPLTPLSLGKRVAGGEGTAGTTVATSLWPKATVLAGSTLATLLVCLVAIQQLGNGGNTPLTRTAASTAAPAGSAAVSPLPTASPAAIMVAPGIGSTISLGDLSGPELEAVFDLWERGQDDENQSIAF